MKVRNVMVGAVAVLTVGALTSCGSNDATAVPTPTELAAKLVTSDDLQGDWVMFEGPGDDQVLDPSGILTEEQRALVPSFELCDRASDEAKGVASTLLPIVFRQMDLKVDDDLQPPFDRSGHMIFMQQFLYAGEPDEMARSFELVRDGMIACFGEIPAGEEGPGRASELAVPEVGDDRLGVLMTIEEAGGWAEWRIYEVLTRDGPVLMKFVVVDIRAGEDPYFTTEEFGDMARTAAAKL